MILLIFNEFLTCLEKHKPLRFRGQNRRPDSDRFYMSIIIFSSTFTFPTGKANVLHHTTYSFIYIYTFFYMKNVNMI